MATRIGMKHQASGLVKDGFFGFSWTTLFFGCFPALFRKDFITFICGFAVLVILALATAGIGVFIAMPLWAFFYNGYYTRRLLESGYVLYGSDSEMDAAASALGVSIPRATSEQSSRQAIQPTVASPAMAKPTIAKEKKSLDNDAYKLYLVKKYSIEFNDVLKKYIINDTLHDSVDLALQAAHSIESEQDLKADKINKIWSFNEAKRYLEEQGYLITSIENRHEATQRGTTRYFKDDEEVIDFVKQSVLHKQQWAAT